ncbi:MAG: HlyD family efflux transporter periplasmic adaptor subunit [bacterium]|nr:HlyD family efflux transporter periplasmic adaptor subunit [bacterium]
MGKSAGVALVTGLLLAGCGRPTPAGYQGYLEGEFVYVAAPLGGQLERLAVSRGARVEAGAPLFTLEQSAELSTLREAAERLRQSQARLADLRKGSRPTELAVLEARLAQARTAAELSGRELERATKLHQTTVLSDDDYDRVRLNHEANLKAVAETAAQLETARLGGRADAIAAAEADAAAAQAALDRAGWSVAQKSRAAPQAALVFDTLFREGEFVAAGQPVVALLPPATIKVRFFVPEPGFAALKAGDAVKVALTGRATPLDARVRYLSPQPEDTPPVLYNRENRAKLVFMVEAVFDPAAARDLHPGQPVDVTVVR